MRLPFFPDSTKASSRASAEDRLEAARVSVHFEGIAAVDQVDLGVDRGEILGLIGPNGAGKTTLVNALSGFQRPTAGQVRVDGRDVTGWSPHRLAKVGLTRTFQGVRVFAELTVLQNVEVAAVCSGLSRRQAYRAAIRLVDEVGLNERVHLPASSLPHGDARRLSIARAMARNPSYLLLDEPAAGLNEVESNALMTTIATIRAQRDCGILLIDHDMRVIMGTCDRVQVLNYGHTISMGTPAAVQRDEAVITAYLGTKKVSHRA